MLNMRVSKIRWHACAGIALGPIHFLIAILAILAAVVAASANRTTFTANNDSAKVMAQTIIQESEQVLNTVQLLMSHGCDETQLNFYALSNGQTIYANSSAPTDGHCNVFDPRGGNMIYTILPNKACAAGLNTCIWDVSSGNVIPGVGTGAPQPIWIAFYLDSTVCDQINAQLGRATNTTVSPIGDYGYPGTFTPSTTLNAVYTGVTAACLKQNSVDNIFYRVLWTR
jgi:type II secretory pathway pseudopilin PulG